MRSLAELGKTLAVLAGLWAVLALIGWGAGAFPHLAPVGSPDAGSADTLDDAGAPAADAAVAMPDALREEPDAPAGAVVESLPVVGVCDAPARAVWALGDLAGGDDPEVVLACAGAVEVLAWGAAEPTPHRIARISLREGTEVQDLAIGDVDADGRADLVVSLDDGLYVVARDASGAFAPPRTLAPGRSGALVLAPLDAEPGLDLAVAHGADPRPEIWIFRGGPTPVRSASVPAPVATSSIAALDLDVDGHLDLAVVGSHQILLAFGESRASVLRSRSLTPGGRGGAAIVDVDGVAPAELVIEADAGACVLHPSPELAEAAGCTSIATLDSLARGLRADGPHLVGVRHPDVVSWTPAGTATLATLATERFGMHRAAFVSDAVWILGSSPREESARELQLVRAPQGTTFREAERVDPIDAPLVLTLSLPDPDAP